MTPLAYQAKVVFVGEPGVGKRTLAGTHHVDWTTNYFNVDRKNLTLTFFHPPTQGPDRENYAWFRGVRVVVIVYDVTSQQSFNATKEWCRIIDRYATEDFLQLLVGNRCECISKRMVDYNVAKEFANGRFAYFGEISTTTHEGVALLKQKIAECALVKLDHRPFYPQIAERSQSLPPIWLEPPRAPQQRNLSERNIAKVKANQHSTQEQQRATLPLLTLLVISLACAILVRQFWNSK